MHSVRVFCTFWKLMQRKELFAFQCWCFFFLFFFVIFIVFVGLNVCVIDWITYLLHFYFSLQIRYRFGLYDEISISNGFRVRHCNWIRFLRVSETYGPQVCFHLHFFIVFFYIKSRLILLSRILKNDRFVLSSE